VAPITPKPAVTLVQPATPAAQEPAHKPVLTPATALKTPIVALSASDLDAVGADKEVTLHLGDGEAILLRRSNGRWISSGFVTQAQWKAVMGWVPGRLSGWNLPVGDVSSDALRSFCDQLQQKVKLPPGWQAGSTDAMGRSGWRLLLY
jgi:hypothetical protein